MNQFAPRVFLSKLDCERLFHALDDLQARGGGAILNGPSGTGKTTLIRDYVGRPFDPELPQADELPIHFPAVARCEVASVTICPSCNSAHAFLVEILVAIGCMRPSNLPIRDLLSLVRFELGRARIGALVVDDSHHLWASVARAHKLNRGAFLTVIEYLTRTVPTIFVGHDNFQDRPTVRVGASMVIGELRFARLLFHRRLPTELVPRSTADLLAPGRA